MAPVILYSQAGCPACAAAKQFLAAQGVTYEEKDIRGDPEFLRELVDDLKSRTTPTLVVGEKVVMEFDPDKFLDAIGARSSEGKQI
jgi:glutaredoxin